MRSWKSELGVALLLSVIGIAGRLLPHAWNVNPLVAVSLFGGYLFVRRGFALMVPFASLAVGDVAFGTYNWLIMALVYTSLLFPVAFRSFLKRHPSGLRIGVASVASSLVFFIVVDLGVWAFSGLYPRTGAGLWSCYLAAIPFLRNALVGDLAWSSLLFGTYFLVQSTLAAKLTPMPRGQ